MHNPGNSLDPQLNTSGPDYISLNNGVLQVTGTNNIDDIRFREIAGNMLRVIATLNGNRQSKRYDKADVDSILVNARSGNDFVDNRTDVKSVVYGGNGKDKIFGGFNDDTLFGQAGDDTLNGRSGDDEILGQSGKDTIRGDSGDDIVKGGGGGDSIFGGDGDDILLGWSGADKIIGDDGDDIIRGGSDNDNLQGKTGDDLLAGGRGNDNMHGNHGFDSLNGQLGNDILKGIFGFDALVGGGQAGDKVTTIFDIDSNQDTVNKDYSSGDLTLREAVRLADDYDIIRFDPLLKSGDATITMQGGEFQLDSDITIQGKSNNLLTIDADGGSRIFDVSAKVIVKNLHLTNGDSADGGSIRVASQSKLTLLDSTVSDSASTDGGGIYADTNSTVIIDRSTIRGNVASNDGGGIYNLGGNVHISNSTINDNTSETNAGGGINQTDGGGLLTLVNSTVSGNSARYQGGISIFEGTYEITNSTIAFNESTLVGFGGGGIGVSQPGTINNTIIVGNIVDGAANDLSEIVDNANWFNNLIGVVQGSSIANGFNGHIVGVAAGATLRLNLEDNGGPTLTHALVAGSAAIDNGRDDKALDRFGEQLETDQTGGLRFLDVSVDIGSVES